MDNIDTHIICDGKQVRISKNLEEVLDFLIAISNEVGYLIDSEQKLIKARNVIKRLLEITKEFYTVIENNNINIKPGESLKEIYNDAKESIDYQYPIRSISIVLFSYIEVLYCIYLSYNKKMSDQDLLIKLAMNQENIRNFINSFILNNDNYYYRAEKYRLSKMTFDNFRSLRNSLVHFFSTTSEIIIHHPNDTEKARKIETVLNKSSIKQIQCISTNDLYELIKAASILMLNKWTNESKTNPEIFKEKIMKVKELIVNFGTVSIKSSQINVE